MNQIPIDFDKPIIHNENNVTSQNSFDDNRPKFNKQCEIVYNALLRGERLTTTVALLKYKVGDLRRRVKDLKDTFNIPVQSEYVEGGYKEYFLH